MKQILFSIVLLCIFFTSSANYDSIGVVNIKGSIYIKHKVEKSEGLYAVGRRYNVSVDEIKKANGDSLETLILDQIIYVPYMKKVVLKQEKKHKVEKGQTLYQVSKMYNVSVDDIKKWNKLENDNIKEGQELIIYLFEDKLVSAKEKENEDKKETEQIDEEKEEDVVVVDQPKDGKDNVIVEEGIATYVDDQSFNSRSSLALHKTAPIGTIIKVTNLLNGKEVFVKVVGNMPKENTKDIIRLNKYSARKLKIRDKITRVKLEYHK